MNNIKQTLNALIIGSALTACQSNIPSTQSVSADQAIEQVLSYGFVDLEGAKVSAIIVEYNQPVLASSVHTDNFVITDYTRHLVEKDGFAKTVERDGDNTQGNEGEITKVYVNDKPEPSASGGTASGRYVIIEVNTDYMLKGQNLAYTASMMAGVKQVGTLSSTTGKITPSSREISNYTVSAQYNPYRKQMTDVIATDPNKIILPEFDKNSGWTINRIGAGAFKATKAYSEYTGKYSDFELPYAIYVPDAKTLAQHQGKVALVIHMEHAGANDTEPLAALTSSRAAVKLSNKAFQQQHPAIVIVPQIEESRRSTNDMNSSSEANTAVWELLDSVLKQYSAYIDTNRIYGTGQSMGGMTILNMAAQRDNFFGGIAVVGAQWGNNYNKPFQNNGAPARSPANDPISFNGFGLDKKNYQNWYYMVSDDNIMVLTAKGDVLATGQWQYLADYFAMAGAPVTHQQWDPYLPTAQQNQLLKTMAASHNARQAGGGINWGLFTRGTHMSTWKYAYQLDYPFEWLFRQNRQTAVARGKLKQLAKPWLGRNAQGQIVSGSGTTALNSAQFNLQGESNIFKEAWTPLIATQRMIDALPSADKTTADNQKAVTEARTAYGLLSKAEQAKLNNMAKLMSAEKALAE